MRHSRELFRLDITHTKKRLIMKTVEQWKRVPRKNVLSIPLKVFNTRLDKALEQHDLISELAQLSAGGWTRDLLKSLPICIAL